MFGLTGSRNLLLLLLKLRSTAGQGSLLSERATTMLQVPGEWRHAPIAFPFHSSLRQRPATHMQHRALKNLFGAWLGTVQGEVNLLFPV